MITMGQITDWLNAWAPFSRSEDWDNTGLLVGDARWEVTGVLVTLDATKEAVQAARHQGANLILTHHPVIFHPVRCLPGDSCLAELVRCGMGVLSAHTNLDRASGGVNDALCAALGLQGVRPLEGSDELGRIGRLPREMAIPELAVQVKHCLSARQTLYLPREGLAVRQVAVVSGAGGEFWPQARQAGADVLVTGEVRHHEWMDAGSAGFPLIEAGHYDTEAVILQPLADRLKQEFPGLAVETWNSFAVQAV